MAEVTILRGMNTMAVPAYQLQLINMFTYLYEKYQIFNHNYRISYSIVEEVKNIENIKHKAVKNILKYLNLKKNLEIHYDGDLPSKSGVGSSSCFVVGLLNCIYILIKRK